MSVHGISPVGTQPQVPYAPPAATADSPPAAGDSASASQSVAQTAQLSSQFASTTSVTSQAQSYFASVDQSGFDQELLRLIIVLMLLDEMLNGDRGSENRLAMLGLALGLAGGTQSSYQFASSFESFSFSQQTSMTTVATGGVNGVTEAYGGPGSADGNMNLEGGSGQRIDVTG